MDDFTSEQEEERKKAIFESMSPRRQKHILKKGYDAWNPFQEPKDPIDIRKDATKRTTQELVRAFLQAQSHENYSSDFGRGAFDICHGLINNDEKCRGMYAFSVWYQELLKAEGHL